MYTTPSESCFGTVDNSGDNLKVVFDRLRNAGWYPNPQDRKVVRLSSAGSSPVSVTKSCPNSEACGNVAD